MHGFQRGNIVGADGYSIFDGNNYSDREYVKQAMQGNVYVSDTVIFLRILFIFCTSFSINLLFSSPFP